MEAARRKLFDASRIIAASSDVLVFTGAGASFERRRGLGESHGRWGAAGHGPRGRGQPRRTRL